MIGGAGGRGIGQGEENFVEEERRKRERAGLGPEELGPYRGKMVGEGGGLVGLNFEFGQSRGKKVNSWTLIGLFFKLLLIYI